MNEESFAALSTPSGAALLAQVVAAAPADDDAALALGSRLRRDHPPHLVATAITQARLRERGRAKFGDAAAAMYFTPEGLEQATRADVAAHRAARFARLGPGARVADLCTGIGADLLALARAGGPGSGTSVTGVEVDPLTAAVAAANVAAEPGARVILADATAHDLRGYDAVFCDPARRNARGRVFDPAAYSPPWAFLCSLLAGTSAAKVAPGIPHEIVPAGVETEWVSVRGEVKEAALYAGALTSTGPDGPVRRRATLLPGGHTLTATGPDTDEEPPGVGAPLRWLYEPDGAVVRSHLVGAVAGALGGRLLDPTIAYVTADTLTPTPFATAYEVTDVLPFSVKALRALLRRRGVGRVTVKKRGSAVTPEELRRQLALRGDGEATVVLTRCSGAPTMLLVRPVPGFGAAPGPVPEPTAGEPALARRTFLTGGVAVIGSGAFFPPGVLRQPERAPQQVGTLARGFTAGLTPTPFTLGVASGDPTPDGMVLWTRLAIDPLADDGGGGMPPLDLAVDWQLALDEKFRRLVRAGTETARPEAGHSVHVEPAGLEPGRVYFFRFRCAGYLSPTGRTRTAPAPPWGGDVHFAVASCSNLERGYFTAYRHLAESAPDLVFHLGDYTYSTKADPTLTTLVREHLGPAPTKLAEFRLRHAQYKTDPDLQAAHAAAPWVVAFDDHDVLDNWAGDTAADPKHQRTFPAIRAAAMQAFYENLPLRLTSLPVAGRMQLFRRTSWGRTATFHVLDTRQHRDAQSCGPRFVVECPERLDPARTILGAEQEAWLAASLHASGATWNVLAQQVFFCPNEHMRAVPAGSDPPVAGWNMDTWDGYAAARDRLVSTLATAEIRNPVVLSGDVHSAWAGEILRDFGGSTYEPLGVELVTTSISSGGDGSTTSTWGEEALATQPYLKYFNRRRGWTAVRAGPDELRADFRTVSFVKKPGAPVTTAASFVVQNGTPRLNRV